MVNSRVPVTEETRNDLRQFAGGLDMTYDDAIRFLLKRSLREGEDFMLAGHRLREEAKQIMKENPSE